MDSSTIKIDKVQCLPFNPNDQQSNFKIWKFKFQTLASSLGLEEAFKDDCKDSEKDKKLKTMIMFSLPDQTLTLITTSFLEGKASVIWSALLKIYESDTIATKTVLKSTFLKLKKSGDENMTHYVSRLLNLADQLNDMGESPSESDKMFVLMSGLEHDNQYSSIVDSLQIQPDMTFQIASQHLINWYDKQKLSGNLKTEVKPHSVDKLHFNQ